MTSRDKLHRFVDELSEDEAEAALHRLLQERVAVEQWAATEEGPAVEDAWALANAHDAVREEPW